ncbi:hypothetical protein EW146_g1004 [Bondarzewia mesenterica]|uniref:Peptidase A1 domain-containing protein n=1 Tax=Bondarzewia mesenterica TaxID=1095465 RepID=A0A4S4M532_9AGAM|nr:hypothetical protein EW146_g1004 [Bondarzewia mesenterica]
MATDYSRPEYLTALAVSRNNPVQHRRDASQRTRALTNAIPDMRFEQTYLKRILPYVHIERRTSAPIGASDETGKRKEKADGDVDAEEVSEEVITVQWGKVFWITTRDQVISPLLQGALWGTASVFIRPALSSLGTRVRQWWPSHQQPPSGYEGKGVGALRSWAKSLFGGTGFALSGVPHWTRTSTRQTLTPGPSLYIDLYERGFWINRLFSSTMRLLVTFLYLAVLSPTRALVAPFPSLTSSESETLSISTTAGVSLSVHFDVRQSSASEIHSINRQDIIYLANVTIGGRPFALQLDTGSSDLWIHRQEGVQITKQTQEFVKVEYGLGWVSGRTAYAPFEVGNLKIPSQAFINSDASADLDDIDGLWGLGFDRASEIHTVASRSSPSSDASSLTPLSNIFSQNISSPNFLTIDLGRSSSGESSSSGTFTVSSYDSQYSTMADEPHLPTVDPGRMTSRWEVVLGGLSVNGVAFDISKTKSASTTAVIDSGTSFALIDDAAADLIYNSIPGAKSCVINNAKYWAQSFPVHPLDLTVILTTDDEAHTVCAGVFLGKSSARGLQDEPLWILGDSFMRNVYTAFHFGSETLSGGFSGAPSIQILSKTDTDAASREFRQKRWVTLKDFPPLLEPKDVNCGTVPHP